MSEKEQFKKCISKKQYQKALTIFHKIINQQEYSKVEELVFYQKIFIYSTDESFKNFSETILKCILDKYPDFIEKKKQLDILNIEYEPILKRKEELEHIIGNYNPLTVLESYIRCFEVTEHMLNEQLTVAPQNISEIMGIRENNFSTISKFISENIKNNRPIHQEQYRIKETCHKICVEYYRIIQKLQRLDDLYSSFIEHGCKIIRYDMESQIFELCELSKQEQIYSIYRQRRAEFDFYNLIKRASKQEIINNQITVHDICQCIDLGENDYEILTKINEEIFLKITLQIQAYTVYYMEKICYTYFTKADKLNQHVVINKKKQEFTFADMIFFFNCLYALSNLQFVSEIYYKETKMKNSQKPFIKMERSLLYTCVMAMFQQYEHEEKDKTTGNILNVRNDISDKGLEMLIDFYSFGKYEVKDIGSTPLIAIGNDIYILPSAVIENNYLNNFIKHLKYLGINFNEGDLLEEYVQIMMKEHGFQVYDLKKPKLNFTTKSGHKGDIDVMAVKDSYIFCFQLKNWSNPLDEQDFKNYDRKLYKATDQLRYVEEYIAEHPKELENFFGSNALDGKNIIKSLISRSFYRSGDKLEDIYFIDIQAINILFDIGKVTIQGKEIVLRENDTVSGEELANFLSKPFLWNVNNFVSLKTWC